MFGRSWTQSFVVGGALLLALQAVSGCNTVLGIEPAELDETVGVPACPRLHRLVANTDCEPCSDDAQGQCELAGCLADHDCRMGLRAFRNCLGHACMDQDNACLGCTTNKKALDVIQCLDRQGCSAGAPTSVCVEYCSCMILQCPAEAPDGDKGIDGCIKACEQGASPAWLARLEDVDVNLWTGPQESWRPYCLWEHCELAADPLGHNHCGHAVGKVRWCSQKPTEDLQSESCPANKNFSNFPCNTGEDCCSGSCRSDTQACD